MQHCNFNAQKLSLQRKQHPSPLIARQEKLLTAAWQSPSSALIPRPALRRYVCLLRPALLCAPAGSERAPHHVVHACSLPSHAYPCWECPELGPSGSSPDAGKVTPLPYACQRTAGLLWLHVCNRLKKTSRLAYSADYKEWFTKCGFLPDQPVPLHLCDCEGLSWSVLFLCSQEVCSSSSSHGQYHTVSHWEHFFLSIWKGLAFGVFSSITLNIFFSHRQWTVSLRLGLCAAQQDAEAAWCLLYSSSMNEWCNRAGGKHHHFGRKGKRRLESWEMSINIHQVPSSPFQLPFKMCFNKFVVRHCCTDISV